MNHPAGEVVISRGRPVGTKRHAKKKEDTRRIIVTVGKIAYAELSKHANALGITRAELIRQQIKDYNSLCADGWLPDVVGSKNTGTLVVSPPEKTLSGLARLAKRWETNATLYAACVLEAMALQPDLNPVWLLTERFGKDDDRSAATSCGSEGVPSSLSLRLPPTTVATLRDFADTCTLTLGEFVARLLEIHAASPDADEIPLRVADPSAVEQRIRDEQSSPDTDDQPSPMPSSGLCNDYSI